MQALGVGKDLVQRDLPPCVFAEANDLAEALLAQEPQGIVDIVRQRLEDGVRVAHHDCSGELGLAQQLGHFGGPAVGDAGVLQLDWCDQEDSLKHEQADEDQGPEKLHKIERRLAQPRSVNYPDTDPKFTNDTGHWLLLRTWVGSSSLTVALYGTPVHRRVVSEVAPLVVTGPPPIRKVSDPTLYVGQTALEESGSPSRSTSVERKVYDANGKLLYDTRFYSPTAARCASIRVGTKPKPALGSDRDDDHRHDDDHQEADDYDVDDDDASAVAIASARPAGIRVGRRVFESTHAWDVQPSAIASPAVFVIS